VNNRELCLAQINAAKEEDENKENKMKERGKERPAMKGAKHII